MFGRASNEVHFKTGKELVCKNAILHYLDKNGIKFKKGRSDCQILKNGVKLPEISWNPLFNFASIVLHFLSSRENNGAILSAIQATGPHF